MRTSFFSIPLGERLCIKFPNTTNIVIVDISPLARVLGQAIIGDGDNYVIAVVMVDS